MFKKSVSLVLAVLMVACCFAFTACGNKDEKEFKKGLKSASGWLRRELGAALELCYTPELVFEIDHSIEYGAKISGILENLNIPKDEEEPE